MSVLFGAAVWLVLTASSALGIASLGAIEVLFLSAPLVSIPLAFDVAASQGRGESRVARLARTVQPAAALLASCSFLLPAGFRAAALATPWLAVTGLAGLWGMFLTPRTGRDASSRCVTAGLLYLPVGGGWLILSRAGIHPMGFVEPIVLLTAAHFHVAASAAPILAGAIGRVLPDRTAGRRLFAPTAAAILIGPALLAAGWTFHSPGLKLAAATLLAGGHALLAFLALIAAPGLPSRAGRTLLRVSGSTLLAGIALAFLYALGEYRETSWIGIPAMARWHGAANAIGFVAGGLLAFALSPRERATPQALTVLRKGVQP